MAKSKNTRVKLTWDEIKKIETDWKEDQGPGKKDIQKLITHIRFIENRLELANQIIMSYEILHKLEEKDIK
jgi:hypothetical protein